MTSITTEHQARAAWSRLTEPGDEVAHTVIETFGAVEALEWAREHAPRAAAGERLEGAAAQCAKSLRRWASRLPDLSVEKDLDTLMRLRGTLLIPTDQQWPTWLADLGAAAPLCLWIRGSDDLRDMLTKSVSIVGARACTHYGLDVAGSLSTAAVDAGHTVVSGGAFGIDKEAHRVALALEGRTVAFLAGGVDRLYPAGNASLLDRIINEGGAVIAEVPPGSVPARVRFLQRNRLIAAISRGTVVVEAAHRSGAMATAHRANELFRPVGAVPGPVTSASSVGCHDLIRNSQATCITSGDDLLGMLTPLSQQGDLLAPAYEDDRQTRLTSVEARVRDAFPRSRATTVGSLMRVSGLSDREVLSSLGRLSLLGYVSKTEAGWRLIHQNARLTQGGGVT